MSFQQPPPLPTGSGALGARMELLILAGAVLCGGVALVVWLNLADDWRDRDEWDRFQEAMRSQTQRKDNQ